MKASCKRPPGFSKPEVGAFDVKELQDIIERAGSGPLSEADRAKLLETVGTLAYLQQELANKDASLARLRSLFGLSTSEKTKDVLGDESGDKSAGGTGGGEENAKKKRKGHGRKGAKDYEGAERIRVEHETLKPGDPCPECPVNKRGKVYKLSPRTLVRVVGQAPLQATVYELEALRSTTRRPRA